MWVVHGVATMQQTLSAGAAARPIELVMFVAHPDVLVVAMLAML
jgi:hypothetical protein